MRPDVGFAQALRLPLALQLQALRTWFAQNQLRLRSMADIEARTGAATAAAGLVARARTFGGLWPTLGLALAAGLGILALIASGGGEFLFLALLGLLAVAGAFLIFG